LGQAVSKVGVDWSLPAEKALEAHPEARFCALCDLRDPQNPPPEFQDPRWNWLCRDCACAVLQSLMNLLDFCYRQSWITTSVDLDSMMKGVKRHVISGFTGPHTPRSNDSGEFGDQT
jgi:hypothetical protein